MGISHLRTSIYYPKSNANAELRNKHIIRHLRAHCDNNKEFYKFLPAVECAINNFYVSSLGGSPYNFVFGREYVFPIQKALTDHQEHLWQLPHSAGLEEVFQRFKILRNILKQNIAESREEMVRIRNKGAIPPSYQIGQTVYVDSVVAADRHHRTKHDRKYLGPALICDMLGTSLVKLTLSIQVKPYATGLT